MGSGFQTPGAWFSKVGSPVFCSSGTILGIRGLAVGWVGLDHLARPPGSPTTWLAHHLARPPGALSGQFSVTTIKGQLKLA